jgi:hypothetical protein
MAPGRWPHAHTTAARPCTGGPSTAVDVGHVRPYPFARGCSGGVPSPSDSSRHLTCSHSSAIDALPCLAVADHRLATARVPTTFLNRQSPTSTTERRPSPPFPFGRAAPLWKPPSGEPPPSPVTKSGPPPHQPSLRPMAPPHCATARRNRRRRRAPWGFPCLCLGPKGPMGWAGRHGQEGLWPRGLSPFQQRNFIFSLRIYSIPIQFKSKLVKFVGT